MGLQSSRHRVIATRMGYIVQPPSSMLLVLNG